MAFDEEDMVIDEGTGYPRAYALLCRDRHAVGIYTSGPPYSYAPSPLHPDEIRRAEQLEEAFPMVDPKAKPMASPMMFAGLLWKQLSHLGNAGFDPALIRVDHFGNVLYFRADKASPLAWDIDHWYPRCRGGLTVPTNLRILQWQVCRRKHNKLEFLIPWWDFQLGISVNQFLSIFASSNSDFRRRGFAFLFSGGELEELHDTLPVHSHNFPHHFVQSQEQLGLAAAAFVASKRDRYEPSLALCLADCNRQSNLRKNGDLKENDNPYQAIVAARDSLKLRDAHKMQTEIQKLDSEIDERMMKNDAERISIQELELQLVKHKRKAEKCRRLAETQTSYRTTLETMIRDAMHQTVVYKEQIRVTQAATSALSARLEAQKAICDASERDLKMRFSQKNNLEVQIQHTLEQTRKRLRQEDDMNVLLLEGPEQEVENDSGNEVAVQVEPEGKMKDEEEEEEKAKEEEKAEEGEEEERGDEEDSLAERGKGNVEKWLKLLLENSEENRCSKGEILRKLDEKFPLQAESPAAAETKNTVEKVKSSRNFNAAERNSRKGGLKRSESAKTLRRIPSSPLIMGMKKGVECMMKKKSSGDDDPSSRRVSFIKSSIKPIKKALKL